MDELVKGQGVQVDDCVFQPFTKNEAFVSPSVILLWFLLILVLAGIVL